MTKDKAEAIDGLRVAIRTSRFDLGDEAEALRERAAEKERRLRRRAANRMKYKEQQKEKKAEGEAMPGGGYQERDRTTGWDLTRQ